MFTWDLSGILNKPIFRVRKKFFINIIFLIGLNLLIKPFWILGVDREIQNIVGNENYGLYFTLFNFTFLFQILLDLGITNYNNQSVAKNHNFLAQNFAKLGGLKLGLAFLYLLITILASYTMGYSTKAIHLLYFLAFNQFLLSFILFLRSNISGLQIFWLDSLISVLDRVLLISICSILIWGNVTETTFQVEWLAYAQTTAYSVTFLVCLSVVMIKAKSFFTIPNMEFIKTVMVKSLPFALIIFFMTMYFRADVVMIEKLLPNGNYEAGVYAQGYRFFDLLNNFVYLFTAILFPLISKELAAKNSVGHLTTFVMKFLGVSFLLLIGIGMYLSKEVIVLSYSDVQPQSATVLTILLFTFVPMVFSSIYGTVLTAGGRLKEMMLWSGVAFSFNVILNLLLIPKYGVVGAAVASFSAQTIMAMSCYMLAGNIFKSFIPLKVLFEILIPIITVCAVIWQFSISLSPIQIFAILLICSTILFIVFLFRSYKEFKVIQKLNSLDK